MFKSLASNNGNASKNEMIQIREKNNNDRLCCLSLFVGNITSTHRSSAIAVIENVDKNMLKPCREPAILQSVLPKGQKLKIYNSLNNNLYFISDAYMLNTM
jgi:hypothetical protein